MEIYSAKREGSMCSSSAGLLGRGSTGCCLLTNAETGLVYTAAAAALTRSCNVGQTDKSTYLRDVVCGPPGCVLTRLLTRAYDQFVRIVLLITWRS